MVATNKIFTQGLIKQTSNPLDMMIEGDGFFQIQMPDGSIGYTRDGTGLKETRAVNASKPQLVE